MQSGVMIYKCTGLCKWTDAAALYQTSLQAFLLGLLALIRYASVRVYIVSRVEKIPERNSSPHRE